MSNNKNNLKFEVCVDSIESALIAEQSGASRIELCSSLFEGGLTPSYGMIKLATQKIKIPIHVMIRPRGGDFLYDEDEFQIMKEDILIAKKFNCAGVVFGCLNANGTIDEIKTKELIELARPLSVTFHRAFDRTRDLIESLKTLIKLSVDRVLTSGGEETCLEGLPMLTKLVECAKDDIIILPGGGIHERNIERIAACGAKEFHFSARKTVDSKMEFRKGDFLGGVLRRSEFSKSICSKERFTKIVNSLKKE